MTRKTFQVHDDVPTAMYNQEPVASAQEPAAPPIVPSTDIKVPRAPAKEPPVTMQTAAIPRTSSGSPNQVPVSNTQKLAAFTTVSGWDTQTPSVPSAALTKHQLLILQHQHLKTKHQLLLLQHQQQKVQPMVQFMLPHCLTLQNPVVLEPPLPWLLTTTPMIW